MESRTSLVSQWLRLCTPDAGRGDSIPGQGTKIPRAAAGVSERVSMEGVSVRVIVLGPKENPSLEQTH